LKLIQRESLPGCFPDLLQNGQLFAALILSTTFSEKYRGNNMWPDKPQVTQYKDEVGDRIRFILEEGQLVKSVNGHRQCGLDDSTGVVRKLEWSPGNRVVDQYGCGGICPGHVLGSLHSMVELAGIEHNLPPLLEICASVELSPENVATAEVKQPGGLGTWRPTLLGRYGNEESTPYIWLGDAGEGDRTLYVAFGPLRQGRQVIKVCCAGSDLKLDQWGESAIWISGYMKTKLDFLWDPEHYDFYGKLEEIASKYKGVTDKILFCGISHGAALAQAAALKFALCAPQHRPRVHVASWNAYKWTDDAGSELACHVFSDGDRARNRCLPFILSKELQSCCGRRRRYDSVTEFPPDFAPMHDPVILDVDAGTLWGNVELGNVNLGLDFFVRAMDVHFAKEAIRGIKAAMTLEHQPDGSVALRNESALLP